MGDREDVPFSDLLNLFSSDADASDFISFIQVYYQSSQFKLSENIVNNFLTHCVSAVGNSTKSITLKHFKRKLFYFRSFSV